MSQILLAITSRASAKIQALRDGSGKIERLRNHHIASDTWQVEGNMIAEEMAMLLQRSP